MKWSPQQDRALSAVSDWLHDTSRQPVYRLFGFAGCGKTTLATHFADNFEGRVKFASFTGKAALVMRAKGCHGASTIHSLIYKLEDERRGNPTFKLNPDSDLTLADLLIVDECSMVNEELGKDVLSFGVPVLVLGDPAQLPPVSGSGFFTEHDPDIMLTEVHRQARDNPIIRMSMDIREGKHLEIGDAGACRVIARKDLDPAQVLAVDQVLVGLNRTRTAYNDRVRQLKGITAAGPIAGDKLVCLRNNRGKSLLNGGLWQVTRMLKQRGRSFGMIVEPEDEGLGVPTEISVHPYFWELLT